MCLKPRCPTWHYSYTHSGKTDVWGLMGGVVDKGVVHISLMEGSYKDDQAIQGFYKPPTRVPT